MVEFIIAFALGLLSGWLIFVKYPKVGDALWLLANGAWSYVTVLWEKITNKRR